MKKELQDYDWHELDNGNAGDALSLFMQILWFLLAKYIPREIVPQVKSVYPWVNDEVKKAIRR